jgi:FtsH-binding integral membrane protein
MKINSSVRNNSRKTASAWHLVVDANQMKAIVMKKVFEHVAALLLFFAVFLFILAILIVRNGVNVEEVLTWEEPMPWAIILTITSLLVLYASRLLPQANR